MKTLFFTLFLALSFSALASSPVADNEKTLLKRLDMSSSEEGVRVSYLVSEYLKNQLLKNIHSAAKLDELSYEVKEEKVAHKEQVKLSIFFKNGALLEQALERVQTNLP